MTTKVIRLKDRSRSFSRKTLRSEAKERLLGWVTLTGTATPNLETATTEEMVAECERLEARHAAHLTKRAPQTECAWCGERAATLGETCIECAEERGAKLDE